MYYRMAIYFDISGPEIFCILSVFFLFSNLVKSALPNFCLLLIWDLFLPRYIMMKQKDFTYTCISHSIISVSFVKYNGTCTMYTNKLWE